MIKKTTHTAEEAAAILDRSVPRITEFCREGRFDCWKHGRAWVIDRASLMRFKRKIRPAGRSIAS